MCLYVNLQIIKLVRNRAKKITTKDAEKAQSSQRSFIHFSALTSVPSAVKKLQIHTELATNRQKANHKGHREGTKFTKKFCFFSVNLRANLRVLCG